VHMHRVNFPAGRPDRVPTHVHSYACTHRANPLTGRPDKVHSHTSTDTHRGSTFLQIGQTRSQHTGSSTWSKGPAMVRPACTRSGAGVPVGASPCWPGWPGWTCAVSPCGTPRQGTHARATSPTGQAPQGPCHMLHVT